MFGQYSEYLPLKACDMLVQICLSWPPGHLFDWPYHILVFSAEFQCYGDSISMQWAWDNDAVLRHRQHVLMSDRYQWAATHKQKGCNHDTKYPCVPLIVWSHYGIILGISVLGISHAHGTLRFLRWLLVGLASLFCCCSQVHDFNRWCWIKLDQFFSMAGGCA